MNLPDFLRSTTLRWTLVVFGVFGAAILLSFGFVYLRTTTYMTDRIDGAVARELEILVAAGQERRNQGIEDWLAQDPRRVKLAALYRADGTKILGNIDAMPANLPLDGPPRDVSIVRIDPMGREQQTVRAMARRMTSGKLLVIGRNVDENVEVGEILGSAIALGLIPALVAGLIAALFLSRRAQHRIAEVNTRVERIIAGELKQRLPTRGTEEPFDKLAAIVNRMLDEIETLVRNLAGVGDDIAHEMRTPLTCARISLERGRAASKTPDELHAVMDKAIAGIDQSLALTNALLRIREIEQVRRMDGFGDVELDALTREVADLYEPMAEDKKIELAVSTHAVPAIRADRDLLFEALANLLDNAVKFTPEGGRIEVSVNRRPGEGVLRVSDDGPGVPAQECDLIAQRFYRSDRSRHTKGLGLGLSLVAAIVKLHGFRLRIVPGPGFIAEIAFDLAAPKELRAAS